MNTLTLELKKCKRSGVIPIMLTVGIVGALYALANFVIRKDALLSLSLPPMVILLTQLYGMIMILNLFGVIVATCMIYNIEHRGCAIKKMYMLPIKPTSIYSCKYLIMTVLLLLCIAIQYTALAGIGIANLPPGNFELSALIQFSLYSFISSLPMLAFMLLISSRYSNMWVTLGIGVAGFFSGLTMAMSNNKLFLLNPFVLLMKPAVSPTIALDYTLIVLSVIETIIFLAVGLFLTKHIHYE